MLQAIRERATGWIAWIIVILITIPFALWGVQEYMGPGGPVVAATVNGTEIPLRAVQQSVQERRSELQRLLGDAASRYIDDKRLRDEVVQQLVDDELRNQAALEGGYRVSDARLSAEISAINAFQREGRFDQAAYERALMRGGYTPKRFEQQVRRDLLANDLLSGVGATAFATPGEIDAYLRLRDQSRTLRYLLLGADAFRGDVEVSDEEIREYYEANRAAYMEPERVMVDYLLLTLESVMAEVEIPGGVLETLYEERKEQFGAAEERRASHILIGVPEGAGEEVVAKAEAAAREIHQRVVAGESFEELAKAHSADPGSAAEGGDLGFFGRGLMDKAFEEAAYALAPGEVSEPVRSSFGFHIIRLEEVRGGQQKPFAEVRAELERDYRRREAESRYIERSEQLVTLAFENADSLAPAAEALGLEVRRSDWFSRQGGNGIAAEAKVAAAAFDEDVLEAGHNSGALELDGDRVAVLRVVDRKQASDKPLEAVREEIVARLEARKAREIAREAGEGLLEAVRGGTDLAALAGEHGAQLFTPGAVRRDGAGVEHREVARAAFRMAPAEEGAAFTTVALADGGVAVVELSAVAAGDPAAPDEAARGDERAKLAQIVGESEALGVMEGLRARADIQIKAVPDDESP